MDRFDKTRFDKTKAWGDVKKGYIFQTIIALIFVALIFSVVIPRVMPPASNSNNTTAIEKVVVRMILAGFEDFEIQAIGMGVKAFHVMMDPSLRQDVESMSDKQLVEFYDIGISELNRLRGWAKEKVICKNKLRDEKISEDK